MIHQVWRLSENDSDDNLGLACTEHGLVLGRTPLVERRDGRFAVREQHEIERLLSRAYGTKVAADRLMSGLATVTAALNANDQGLARIAAVHLRLPDLPDQAARAAMEAEDRLIKSIDWNPDLHPRTGVPPNPGWFATTAGTIQEASPIRTAENENPNQRSDASPGAGEDWVRLPPGKRIDELGDFMEWLANATPKDESAIRAEIKRYFEDVGWHSAAEELNAALSVVLRPDVTRQIREGILHQVSKYALADPAEYTGVRDFFDNAVLAAAALLGKGPSVWKFGWGKRGQAINQKFGDPTFPPNYPVIDKFSKGIATSVKSIDFNAATYQNEVTLENRLEGYVVKVREFNGRNWGGLDITSDAIKGRALQVIVPPGSIDQMKQAVIGRVRARAKQSDRLVDVIVTEFHGE